MNIYNELLNQIPEQEYPVSNLVVGCYWILVSSRQTGLASTLTVEGIHGLYPIREVGRLHTKSANELAGWICSDNWLEASIGLAALNSLLDINVTKTVEVNAADVIARQGKGKNIAIVGHFPFVDRLRSLAKNCWVIEKRPAEGDFPEKAATEFIPQSDVIAITGTSVINHTIEALLALCSPGALVMILGPSTPLTPVFFRYGVSILSGVSVYDEKSAIQTIQQGAIFPQVKGVRLLTMAAQEGNIQWKSN